MNKNTSNYHGYRFPSEIISHAVWVYHRFSLSLRDVEDLLAKRSITVSYEADACGVSSLGQVTRERSSDTKVGWATLGTSSVEIPRSNIRRNAWTRKTNSLDCVLLKPAQVLPIEAYSPERKAEFLHSNAADADDYARAIEKVREMGLDLANIPHYKPAGV